MAETTTEKQVRLVLERKCREIANGLAAQCPAGVGFALFLFDFGDGGNLAYVSNGSRETMIQAVEEWLRHAKAGR